MPNCTKEKPYLVKTFEQGKESFTEDIHQHFHEEIYDPKRLCL